MPSIDYKCRHCGRRFKRLVLKGDDGTKATCPNCHYRDVPADIQAVRLFEGISNFSTLAKDTN